MKLKKISIICAALVSLLFRSNVFADSQESFVRKVVGGGSVYRSIQMTDGNYAYVNGPSITKLSKFSGRKISEIAFSFEVADDSYVLLRGVSQTSNGFVLVGTGQLIDYYGPAQAIVVKVDSDGRIEWTKVFTVNGDLEFRSVISTTDGGFIVTGGVRSHNSHPVLIKFTSDGNVAWSKAFDNLSWSFQSEPTLDGGVILAADLIRNDERFIGTNVIKINGSGNIVWAVTLEMEHFSLESLTALTDRGFLLAGSGGDRNTLLLVYLNADGTVRSKAAYSVNVPSLSISSLAQTPDGGIAIGGIGFLMKINDRQNVIFLKRLGFGNGHVRITSVVAKEDGSYLLFGSAGSDTLLVGLNSEGIVPGCSFSHDLSASKIPFGKLKHQKLTLTTSLFGATTGGTLNAKSKRSSRPISDVCVN